MPNDRILEPKIRASYEKLGLNERQLHILSTAVPKRQYYYQSRLGNRLFNLELGPIALAFCTTSRKEDQALVKKTINEHGRQAFLKHYLPEKGLGWVLENF